MTISLGNLDSLLSISTGPEALASLTYLSGQASGSSVSSVTARTGSAPYRTFDTLEVTSVDDSSNTIVVTGYSSGGYYGSSESVPWYFAVIGRVGNDLLLAGAGSAAQVSVPASTVASYIESGNVGALNNDLFVMAIDGTALGTGATAAQTLTFTSLALPAETVAMVTAAPPTAPVTVTDSAAAVQAGLSTLTGLAAAGNLTAIDLTDQGTPVLTVTAAQLTSDASVLSKIAGAFSLTVTGATVGTTGAIANSAHVGAIAISDSAANVAAALDPLQALETQGHTLSIALTDGGTPTLSLTAAQVTSDGGILKAIAGSYTLVIDGSAPNITVAGIAGHANVVSFTGTAADYAIAASGDGTSFTVSDTGTGRSSTDHLSAITALKFSDFTDFVAQAPSASIITTGNVAELYSAVLARVPDVGGVAFYQAAAAANPGLTLNQLAEFFLNSPEYTGNAAHNYAQSSAGDAQFITDTYTNLLHRAPDTGAVPFYQTVIDKFTNGLTPGTSAYEAAQMAGHAQVLVYFSASAEFLSDVQITAQHPADAQHWLILV
jgi:hypothetical protein